MSHTPLSEREIWYSGKVLNNDSQCFMSEKFAKEHPDLVQHKWRKVEEIEDALAGFMKENCACHIFKTKEECGKDGYLCSCCKRAKYWFSTKKEGNE